jgi:ACDE family multidrug resistance protein
MWVKFYFWLDYSKIPIMRNQKPLYKNKNLLIIYSISLIAVMGVASLAPALPNIAKHFNIKDKEQIGWLIAIFTLPGIILTPLFGVFSDRIGRKKVLIPSFVLFAIAGTTCALIDDFNLLLVVRFFQGVGAASLGSLNVTIIGDIFSGKERGQAMGYNASAISIGTASYPAIGGLLASISWNYPFFLSMLALPVGLAVLFGLENIEPQKNSNFIIYFKNALGSILKKDVLSIYAITFLFFIILYGSILTYTPILLKGKFGSPSHQIGILLSAMSIAMGIAATQTGRISNRFKPAMIVFIVSCMYLVVLLLIPILPTIYLLLLPLLLYGFANGMLLPALQTTLAGKASLEERGMFMSLNGMVLRFGQTIGPLITGLAFTFGIEWAFWSSIVVVLLIMMLSRFVK